MNDTLYIKNMVCPRCIRVVKEELSRLGLAVLDVQLGMARLAQEPGEERLPLIRKTLQENGFDLLTDKKQAIAEQLKALVIELVHSPQAGRLPYENHSSYIARKMGHDYAYLSQLFSSQEGITLEKYIILQKVERVKELLSYGEQRLSEIAYEMDYSSVAHLSAQFKKVTGMAPSEFRKCGARSGLDRVGKPEAK